MSAEKTRKILRRQRPIEESLGTGKEQKGIWKDKSGLPYKGSYDNKSRVSWGLFFLFIFKLKSVSKNQIYILTFCMGSLTLKSYIQQVEE